MGADPYACMEKVFIEDRLQRNHALVAEIRTQEDQLQQEAESQSKPSLWSYFLDNNKRTERQPIGRSVRFEPVPFASKKQESAHFRACVRDNALKRYARDEEQDSDGFHAKLKRAAGRVWSSIAKRGKKLARGSNTTDDTSDPDTAARSSK